MKTRKPNLIQNEAELKLVRSARIAESERLSKRVPLEPWMAERIEANRQWLAMYNATCKNMAHA